MAFAKWMPKDADVISVCETKQSEKFAMLVIKEGGKKDMTELSKRLQKAILGTEIMAQFQKDQEEYLQRMKAAIPNSYGAEIEALLEMYAILKAHNLESEIKLVSSHNLSIVELPINIEGDREPFIALGNDCFTSEDKFFSRKGTSTDAQIEAIYNLVRNFNDFYNDYKLAVEEFTESLERKLEGRAAQEV